MAWNDVGPVVTLEPGETVHWEYWFADFEDVGLQIAGPHPTASPADLGTGIAFDQGKRVEGIDQAVYVVSIRNAHPTSRLRHNLEGGGVR